jgi:hypothetical protein
VKRSGQTDDQTLRSALQVLAGGDTQRLRLVRGIQATAGRMIERYAAVPSLADPRALLPLDAAPPALRTALEQHGAGAASPIARGAARLLRLASGVGLARPLLQGRLSVVALSDDLHETPLHQFLSDVLGQRDFVTSLRLAPRRPNGKPVVQVVAQDGHVLAYAKFGWESLTRRLIRHEATVLSELAPLTRDTVLHVPRIIYAGDWCGLETLVLAPLEGTGQTPRSPADVPVAASVALAGICPQAVERLGDSAFWRHTVSRVTQLAPLLHQSASQVILEARRAVESKWGDIELPTGQIHGDWIPPNMLIRPDGTFNVWDWERSLSNVPLGMDAVQFILYLELRRYLPYRTLVNRVRRCGETALARQGLDPAKLMLLVTLNLLETVLWFGEAKQAGREEDEDSRFSRALAAVLAQR